VIANLGLEIRARSRRFRIPDANHQAVIFVEMLMHRGHGLRSHHLADFAIVVAGEPLRRTGVLQSIRQIRIVEQVVFLIPTRLLDFARVIIGDFQK